jgi:hypothetical protein
MAALALCATALCAVLVFARSKCNRRAAAAEKTVVDIRDPDNVGNEVVVMPSFDNPNDAVADPDNDVGNEVVVMPSFDNPSDAVAAATLQVSIPTVK